MKIKTKSLYSHTNIFQRKDELVAPLNSDFCYNRCPWTRDNSQSDQAYQIASLGHFGKWFPITRTLIYLQEHHAFSQLLSTIIKKWGWASHSKSLSHRAKQQQLSHPSSWWAGIVEYASIMKSDKIEQLKLCQHHWGSQRFKWYPWIVRWIEHNDGNLSLELASIPKCSLRLLLSFLLYMTLSN